MDIDTYNHIRSGGAGFIELPRGLIAVWGKEAVPFLDGMITNDMKTLEDGQQMLAAFPNAQGRLLAVVRVLRDGERFLIETEEATKQKVFEKLYMFTHAGDFFVADFSAEWRYFEFWGEVDLPPVSDWYQFTSDSSQGWFIGNDVSETLRLSLEMSKTLELSAGLYETLRIESGIPKYGVDMDENTIVPELGLDTMISYTKGCYIGQEIIARIHFRGHAAKQLTGLMSEPGAVATGLLPGAELSTPDGKNAGRITSVTRSPKLDRVIALAYVRHDFLTDGTKLKAGDSTAEVTKLPFV
jgi:folate-binding protein YgfZ